MAKIAKTPATTNSMAMVKPVVVITFLIAEAAYIKVINHTAEINTKVRHKNTSCNGTLSAFPKNCGKKAKKKINTLGFVTLVR